MFLGTIYGRPARPDYFRAYIQYPVTPIKTGKISNGGVFVREGESIDTAIRRLKRRLEHSGVTADMRRAYAPYDKPSIQMSKRRSRKKLLKKRAQLNANKHPSKFRFKHR